MSCENTNARLQIKYTTIAGQVPTIPSTNDHNDGTWNPTDIYIGEFFLNSQDDLLWVRTLDGILAVGGTGGSASFIGDFVSKANGGTYSGPVFAPTFSAINMIATTISATAIDATIFGSTGSTYYGDGSNLTGITTNWNGGTVSDPTQFDNTVDFNQDISVNNVYAGTLGYTHIHSDVIVDGGLSASYFVGDGSLLTNLPIGPTANDYTTNAYLDGNIIRYDRTDLADAYSVDLTPILFTQSVASFGWDSATNDATITINDGSFFTINLGIFNNISTAIINATDVYATNFYGTFNGTFSNDIYTTSASLVGTTAVFDRTDGITYSLDLSTLSGGGSGSVGPTGATGSVGATGSQGYRAVMNLSYTGSSLTLGLGTITLPIGVPVNNLGWQQGTRVRVFNDATHYMEGQVTTIIANPQTAGINVNIDYVVGSGSFGAWYVGIAGDLGSSGAGGTLEQTLVIGNTTGTQSIYISSSASQIQGYNGINQHWYNAGAPFVGLGDYYQIENNIGGGETQSYIRFYDEGDTIIENNELYDTINSPANQDAKKTRLWLRPQSIRFNADNQDFDTNTLHIGSEMVISADAFTHESTDYLNNCTAQIVATTDGTGTYTGVTLQAYHNGGASSSKVIVAHDYITNRVDASVGTGTGPFTLIEQTYTDIIVSGTPSFPGITYDRDYSANYTNRSLVDKEYVDGLVASGATGLGGILAIDNTTGANNIIINNNQSIIHGETTDFGVRFTNDPISPDIKWTYIHGDSNGGFARIGVDNTSLEDFGVARMQTRNADNSGADIFLTQGDNNITLNTTDGTDTTTFDMYPQSMVVNGTSPTFQGLEYSSDYSTNFTNRTLVDKEYVDNAAGSSFVYITENTTTGTLTMSTPTSITSTVTDGTIINEDYNGLDYSRKSYDDGLYTTELILDPIGNWDMTQFGEKYTGGGTQGSIRFSSGGQAIDISTTDGLVVTLGTIYSLTNTNIVTTATDITNTTTITQTPTSITVTMSSVGIEYGADYSSTYTNRSLVDKEYVDNLPGGATQTLAQTLVYGNETSATDILLSNNAFTGTSDNIKAAGNLFADAKFSFEDYGGGYWAPSIRVDEGSAQNYIIVGSQSTIIQNNLINEYSKITADPLFINLMVNDLTFASGSNINMTSTTIAYNVEDSSYFSASGSVACGLGIPTSFGNDYIAPNPGFPDFHRRGSVNMLAGPASGQPTYAELDSRTTNGSSYAFIRATDLGGAYPANVFETGGSSGYYSQIEQSPNYIIIESDNPSFEGIKYDTDWSANFVARSLVDKAYVDAAVSGGPGATPSSLGDVLLVGNVATANIDLSGYDIQNVQTIDATNVEVTTIYADPTTGIETINMLNASLLTLMYNT